MSGSSVSKAFVLGAGLGTRLNSLTVFRPKPLIPVFNKPLITFAFDHLLRAGVQRFVVNTHHRPEIYAREFPDASYRGAPIDFLHEPERLETAGGIKNAEGILGDGPFVVYNGDVLADLPVEPAIRHHFRAGNEVTLVLRSHGGPLQVALDERGLVSDVGGRIGAPPRPCHLFTGIYVVEPEFLRRIEPRTKLSVIPIFLDMIRTGARLGGVVVDQGDWWDLGTRDHYIDAHRHLMERHPDLGSLGCTRVHPTAHVAGDAIIEGCSAVGAGAVIGPGAVLRDTVVWEEAAVAPGSVLERCIVTAGQSAGGAECKADF